MAARRGGKRKGSRPIKPLNPANKGKLRAKVGLSKSSSKKGSRKMTVAELNRLKRSKDPLTRRRATFALNARKWKKGGKRRSR